MEITKEMVILARQKSGLSQAKAAAVVGCHLKAYQKWEYGTRAITPGLFKLFLMSTGLLDDPAFAGAFDKVEVFPVQGAAAAAERLRLSLRGAK